MKERLLVIGLLGLATAAAWAQAGLVGGAELASIAREFLGSVNAAERSRITFPLAHAERFDWHYIPRQREGLAWGAMTPPQRQLTNALLAAALSPDGQKKVQGIRTAEEVLYQRSGGSSFRDPGNYFLTFFGQPAAAGPPRERGPWGWRFEGHHLSLNFTLQNNRVISTTPFFFGANPATVREGTHRGLRPLAAEEELGRALLRLFTGALRQKVVISASAPRDIITGVDRRADPGPAQGVPMGAMNEEQRRALWALIEMYAERLRPELAQTELEKITRAGRGKIYFAWAGGAESGQPHYYRIHGPTFLIEYDNTQDNANHIHTVWRDFEGDWGLDLLRDHYARAPRNHAH